MSPCRGQGRAGNMARGNAIVMSCDYHRSYVIQAYKACGIPSDILLAAESVLGATQQVHP